jgi:pimeloyl-ACP methyl ester carboxylesterase
VTGTAGHALVAGPPDAPAIVFVHGTRLTGSFWVAQQAALSGEFRTIAPDLPGHGSRAGERFTLAGASDAVAAAIRAHAADGRAIVVGLSLGGYVAMELAAREPDLVRGLIVSGATAEPAGRLALPFVAFGMALGRLEWARIDRLIAWSFRRRYGPEIAEPIIAGGFWSVGGSVAVRSLVGERFIPRLASYPGPSLIVNGQLDVIFRPGARAFAAAAHDATLLHVRGAAHLANLDRPAAFSEAVRRFARSVAGR